MPPKYFLIVAVLFCITGVPLAANCGMVEQPQDAFPGKYGFFDVVRHFPDSSRIESARNLYKNTCRKLSPSQAMKCLDQLTQLAKDISDKKLECAVYDMRADYFSVNNGLNSKSTTYHKLAVKFAHDNGMAVEKGIYLHRMAIYFSTYHQNTKAINYILRSLDEFKKVGYNKVPEMSLYLFQIADFYYDVDDYVNARSYALEALKYKTSRARLSTNTINTIGLTYRNVQQYDSALVYFNKALNVARAKKDSTWIGIVTGNIGSVYFMQNKYDEALPYITADYNTSIKYNETLNAAIALLRLVAINISRNKLTEAGRQLKEAVRLDGMGLRKPEFKTELFRLQAEYYERTGDLNNALKFRKIYEQSTDSVKKEANHDAIERIRLKWEQENYQQSLIDIQNAEKASGMRRNVIIGFVVLLAVIIGLVYNRMLIKAKNESDVLRLENKRVDNELKNAEKELLSYTHSIEEKNSIINKFKQEIEHLNVQFADDKQTEQLNSLLKTHIMTDASWNEFKRLFSRVHPGFFQRAKEKYPVISETDQRLMALIRLKLDNRAMAGMLGITAEGIKKARQRLRKKINLAADTTLETLIFAV
ncbi:tetratricopeptide repeat protein [Mucilaginibacter limnophilus]|uniref:Tetratricopeptide repeat protein n=1 Tax=Mucilaginibacter limnophilus TaxID=1932778 RepID=A0A3S2Y3E5_9SPHI|nr:tetratricopeptide repeat protein [Mucilaginibacter limnophilus]RVU02598.1 tetratricopeptide repeat protein [Mucilaginibacter limnophilus]